MSETLTLSAEQLEEIYTSSNKTVEMIDRTAASIEAIEAKLIEVGNTSFEDATMAEKGYDAAAEKASRISELNDRKALDVSSLQPCIEHLEAVVAMDDWTTEDLDPFNAAIAKGKALTETSN